MSAVSVYIALGTNLGDRRANLAAAVAQLQGSVVIKRISALYETEPAYLTDQPHFFNAVLHGITLLAPETLLDRLKQIEQELGRTPTVRNGPRLIDLDLLLYGDLQLNTQRLILPHPRIAERPFVLIPLAEIAPDLVLPGEDETIATLAAKVRGNGDVLARVGTLDNAI